MTTARASSTSADALYQVEAWPELKRVGLELFDTAADKTQWPVADSIAHLLAAALKTSGNTDPSYSAEVLKRFTLAHEHVGGHGHGH